MPVIGHHAVAQQPHLLAFHGFGQHRFECLVVKQRFRTPVCPTFFARPNGNVIQGLRKTGFTCNGILVFRSHGLELLIQALQTLFL